MRKLALVALLASSTAFAQKQTQELDVQRGPAAELYIRKRPPSPEAPVLSKELKGLLGTTEKKRDEKRLEAIGLLRGFLDSKPTGEARPRACSSSPSCLWEESRRLYLIKMDDFSRQLENASRKKASASSPKNPGSSSPRPRSSTSSSTTSTQLSPHGSGDVPDRVRRQGRLARRRSDERFQEVIDKYPNSPLYGDSWMMVGEHYFATRSGRRPRRRTSISPMRRRRATSRCSRPRGASGSSARPTGGEGVQARARQGRRGGTQGSEAQRRRSANCATKRSIPRHRVHRRSIDLGARSVRLPGVDRRREVLARRADRVAESYGGQAEWERSNEAYRFLIKMDPARSRTPITSARSSELEQLARRQRRRGRDQGPARELRPEQRLGEAAEDRDALARSLQTTEEMTRVTATNIQGEAQRREKSLKQKPHDGCVTKPDDPPDILALYRDAADAYGSYLAAFGTGKNASPKAVEVRYLARRHPLLPLGQIEKPATSTSRSEARRPASATRKRSSRRWARSRAPRPDAATARERADRQEVRRGRRHVRDAVPGRSEDRRHDLQEGADVLRLRRVRRSDQAVRPDRHELPERSERGRGRRSIFVSLDKAEDFENIEAWARKLKTSNLPAFQAKDQQERLTKSSSTRSSTAARSTPMPASMTKRRRSTSACRKSRRSTRRPRPTR